MRRATKKLVWLTVAALALTAPLWGTSVPDWVRQAAAQPARTYDAETNAEVLLDDSDVVITAPGEYVEHSRRVVRILRPEGRKEGDWLVDVRRGEKVIAVHAWTIDKTGREYEVKDRDFAEKGLFDFELYNDVTARTASAPAAEPGSVIAFESQVRRRDWLNQLHWFYQESVPVRESRFAVQLPAGWEYKAAWSGPSAEPVSAGENRWQWVLRNVSAIVHEPHMPSPFSLAGRMELSYFGGGQPIPPVGSWDGIGKWFNTIDQGRTDPTPEISDKARQLTAGMTDFDAKARALAGFLQENIRYVAIEIGIGGYQPHSAGQVFHALYGDCKDKVTLLSSMLGVIGIRSDYVIIHTHRGVVKPEAPSSIFNHAILAIKLPPEVKAGAYHSLITSKAGDRYILFDPTDEYTPLGDLRGELQDTYALLVTPAGGELIHTPTLAPDTNVLTRTARLTLSDDGGLKGEVREDHSGDHAMELRYRLNSATQQQRVERIERFLNRSLTNFTLESSDYQNLKPSHQDLVVGYKFATQQYGQTRGPLLLVRPRVLGEKQLGLDRKPRHYPVELGRPKRETDEYEIELPAGYEVDDLPNPVKVDMGFASYQSKTEVAGNKLHYWREYLVRDMEVPSERIEDLRKLEGIIGADEAAVAVLKKAPTQAAQKSQ